MIRFEVASNDNVSYPSRGISTLCPFGELLRRIYADYVYDTLNNLITLNQGVQTRSFAYDSLSRLKQANNPESGIINYVYDNNGNLTSKTDARQIATNYVYDNLNRVKTRSYSNEPTGQPITQPVAYIYDNLTNAKGKLIKVTNGTSTTEYTSFDILGRVQNHKQTTDGNIYNSSYVYNLSGALIEETYPSGRVVKNTLDVDGDLQQVQSKKLNGTYQNYANAFTYTSAGAVSNIRLGNGKFENTAFNSRLQPIQIGLGSSATSQNLLKLNFDYGGNDNNGNVKSQIITTPTVGNVAGFVATQVYSYDSLNRIQQATETVANQPTQGWQQTFVYDRYGNRTFDEANTTTLPKNCGTAPNKVICAADITKFNPSANVGDNKLIGTNYDNAGNTKIDGNGQVFTYDAENKQTKVVNAQGVTIGEYFYNGDGQRVKKVVPSTNETTIFVYNAAGKTVAEYSTIVTNQADAKINYTTNDHLGSPRINTDANGNVIARHDTLPFGEEIQRTNYGSDSLRKRFTSYERDVETGLDYAKARMFGSGVGRFTSPDPLQASARTNRPQTWNRYSYALNNPMKFVDPNGMKPKFVFIEYNKLSDEEKRILDNSAVTFGKDNKFTKGQGEALYNYMKSNEQKQLAGFLNMTAGLADIKFSDGKSALNYVQGMSGGTKERIYANVDKELINQLKTISSTKATDNERFIGPTGQSVEHKNPEEGFKYDVTFRENREEGPMQLSFASSKQFERMDGDADQWCENCGESFWDRRQNKVKHMALASNGAEPEEIYALFMARPTGQQIKPNYTIVEEK